MGYWFSHRSKWPKNVIILHISAHLAQTRRLQTVCQSSRYLRSMPTKGVRLERAGSTSTARWFDWFMFEEFLLESFHVGACSMCIHTLQLLWASHKERSWREPEAVVIIHHYPVKWNYRGTRQWNCHQCQRGREGRHTAKETVIHGTSID